MLENLLLVREKQLRETLVFLLRMLAFAAPLYALIFFADLHTLQTLVAGHSSLLLQGMGLEPILHGPSVQVGDFHFFISKDSTAWKSMFVLAALVLSVPGVVWKKRLWGLAGIPIIYMGNLGRVVVIVLAEQAWGYQTALFVHDWLWRFGLIALVLGLWLPWLRWVRSSGTTVAEGT